MGFNSIDHQAALAAFAAAPFDDSLWMGAIDRVAAATGSRMGQLIGWVSPTRVPMNMLSDDMPTTTEH